MKILNNEQFNELLRKLSRMDVEIDKQDELDLLDYHWFLVSILEGLEKESELEILTDSKGTSEYYELLEVDINENKLSELTFKLKEKSTGEIVNKVFNVEKVDDARLQTDRKYYVYDNGELYRFLIKFL